MEITRVLIRNFRCIKEADLVLNKTTVFIGPNNVGKTAILDAVRIALTRRWGQRGTGFTEHDVHLPPGVSDPKLAPPINLQFELEERTPNEWPPDVHTALDDIIQLDPITNRGTIILSVTCPLDPTTGALQPHWQFLNPARQPLTGRGARATNLQEFYDYVPVFYLDSLRNADDEFSARSQFWGRLLRAMNIPDALRNKLKQDLDALNQNLLKADPRLDTITKNLRTITKIAPTDAPGDLDLRALPMQPWEMLAKTEVVYKADDKRPWLPLTNHGQGIQSLAVIFLFDAFVRHVLAELYHPESTPILELEEPEAHLHPQASKSLCQTVLNLAGQKLITTHSPYFVQSVPFRDLRIVRMTDQGTSISWLPPSATTTIPHLPKLDGTIEAHQNILTYDNTTQTLTAKGPIPEDLYRKLLIDYAKHPDAQAITARLKELRKQACLLIPDEELAKLETWARRIRGEIFFARKWLIVEGQSDYLLMHNIATMMGYAFDEHGISVIDAQNSGNPGTFAALARALTIPWVALFDGDAAGNEYLAQIKNRDFENAEITARCTLLPHADIEEQLTRDGLEQELRAILLRLGIKDALSATTDEVINALRCRKTEYAIELCEDLRKDPGLIAKMPTVLKDKINQLRSLR